MSTALCAGRSWQVLRGLGWRGRRKGTGLRGAADLEQQVAPTAPLCRNQAGCRAQTTGKIPPWRSRRGHCGPRQSTPCGVTTSLRVLTGRPPPLPALSSPGGALRSPLAAPLRALHLRCDPSAQQASGLTGLPGAPLFSMCGEGFIARRGSRPPESRHALLPAYTSMSPQ